MRRSLASLAQRNYRQIAKRQGANKHFLSSFRTPSSSLFHSSSVAWSEPKPIFMKVKDCSNCNRTCWSCSKESTEDLFCTDGACSVLSEPPSSDAVNFFALFSMSDSYNLNVKDLELAYKKWLKQLHPDRFTNRSLIEQKFAADWAAMCNSAYATLSDPLSRSKYMLQINGIVFEEEHTMTDPMLLMEIMESSELIEEGSLEELQQLNTKYQKDEGEVVGKISNACDAQDWVAVRTLIPHLSYIHNLLGKIHAKLPSQ